MDNFVDLVERHRNEFYRYIYRMAWDSSVADDVFSSAVLAAWENRHKFTPGTNFRAWMYRIITNKCYVANRETGRTPVSLDNVTESTFEKLTAEEGYEEWLDDTDAFLEECGDEVVRALRVLSPPQRTCFLLRSVNRFSYKEIAEIMDMPFGTVMTHLSRGRAKLRKELLAYGRDRGLVKKPRFRVVPKDNPEPQAEEA